VLENYEGPWAHEYWLARADAYQAYVCITWERTWAPRAPFGSENAAVTAGRMHGVRERRADQKLRTAYGDWDVDRRRVWRGRYLAAFGRLRGRGALNENTGDF
jgi:hypothetical protein